MLEIHQIPVLSDNYVYLAHDAATGMTAVVDPATHEEVFEALEQKGWTLTHILNTHHHADHTGGNLVVKERTGCIIVGPRADRDRIPGIDVEVGDGDSYALGESVAKVFDVPGHTRGHIAYWFGESDALFCGDTLFALGCGRLFEGTPQQMWTSLQKLRALPPQTRVYCAHEYTQANANFAITVEPGNPVLVKRKALIDDMRASGRRTVPSILAEELASNPFLRPDSPDLQKTLGMVGAPLVDVFAETRRRKDNF
ncbi:hydroxyacylglutathione hydrolase [Emcibacter sp. SYSU 3D8]|uniref:hydroxyacylglutathione hydrolase n=1 Tax=Emcibacter sp. SYSU 3D8 TaxID=3133969 RepID=UPI0031FEFC8E